MKLLIDLLGIPGAREILMDDDEIGVFIPYEPNLKKRVGKKSVRAWIAVTLIKQTYKNYPDIIGRLRTEIPKEYKEKYFLSSLTAKARSIGVALTDNHPVEHSTEEKQAIFEDIVGNL